jgi:hypothetical protein
MSIPRIWSLSSLWGEVNRGKGERGTCESSLKVRRGGPVLSLCCYEDVLSRVIWVFLPPFKSSDSFSTFFFCLDFWLQLFLQSRSNCCLLLIRCIEASATESSLEGEILLRILCKSQSPHQSLQWIFWISPSSVSIDLESKRQQKHSFLIITWIRYLIVFVFHVSVVLGVSSCEESTEQETREATSSSLIHTQTLKHQTYLRSHHQESQRHKLFNIISGRVSSFSSRYNFIKSQHCLSLPSSWLQCTLHSISPHLYFASWSQN